MTEPSNAARESPAPAEIFVLKAAAPVRALGIAAVAALLGAGLWVASAVGGWSVVVDVLGAGVLIFAASLALVALLLAARLKTTVRVDDGQVTVTDGPASRSLSWSDIQAVTLAGRRLTLSARHDPTLDLVVRSVRSATDPSFRALLVSVQRHLDADRGYRPLA